jgi:hypothetical protein
MTPDRTMMPKSWSSQREPVILLMPSSFSATIHEQYRDALGRATAELRWSRRRRALAYALGAVPLLTGVARSESCCFRQRLFLAAIHGTLCPLGCVSQA